MVATDTYAVAAAELQQQLSPVVCQGEGAKESSKYSRHTDGSVEMGVEEQRRQFDAVQKLLKPYADAGLSGLSGQQDLLGINGTKAQQQAALLEIFQQ